MKPVQFQTDSQLEFNIRDCEAAVSSNPSSSKVRQYLDERDTCINEQRRRRHIRGARRIVAEYLPDVLTMEMKYRRHRDVTPLQFHYAQCFTLSNFTDACFSIGYYRLHGVI